MKTTQFVRVLTALSFLLAAFPAQAVQAAPADPTQFAPGPAGNLLLDPPVQIRWFVGYPTGSDPSQLAAELAVVSDFNATHTDIQITLDVHSSDTAQAELRSEIDSGNGPDIVGPMGWGAAYNFQGEWLDLSTYITSHTFDTGQFNAELMDLYNTEEGQIGLPFVVYPSALFYNPDLFTTAGLNPPPDAYGEPYILDSVPVDWTWDTVADVGRRLTLDSSGRNTADIDFDPNNIVQYGFSYGWENHPSYWGSFWQGGTPVQGTPGAYSAVVPDAWKDSWTWLYSGIWGSQPFMPNGDAFNNLNGGNVFDTGHVAMVDIPNWYLCCVGGLTGSGGTFQFGAMPTYAGEVGGRIDADTFRIWEGTSYPNEAFDVYEYLVTTGVEKLIIGSEEIPPAFGGMPALTSQQPAWQAAKEAEFPFVSSASWAVMNAGLSYADIPSAEGFMPNRVTAWDLINAFGNLLSNTSGLDLNSEIAGLETYLTDIFNGILPLAIDGFTPDNGPVGTSVTIYGTNFDETTAVDFNGTSASFALVSSTEITATVPAGATTGVISVTTPTGSASSDSNFTVTVPYIKASADEDWVHARDWPAGAEITLTVNGGYVGSATMAQSPWNPADPNDTDAFFDLAGVLDLANGDLVNITDGTTSVDYTVVDLTRVRWFIGLGAGSQPEQIVAEQEVADNFNIGHSGLELILDVHDNSAAQGDLADEIAADNGPDLVGPVGWGGANNFYGEWLDLDPLITSHAFTTDVFNPALMAMYDTEEGQIGLPFAVYPSAIFYNPDLFEAAGLNYPPDEYGESYILDSVPVTWNWDTVAEVGKRLTLDSSGRNATDVDFDAGDIVQYGYTWQWENHPSQIGSFWAGGTMFAGGTPGSYTAQVPDAWRAAWEWTYAGIWGPQPWMANGGVENSPEFNGGNAFDSGRIAMTDSPVWYTCCVGSLAEFQFAAMPEYNGTVGGRIDADAFRIWEGTANPDAAFEAMAYLVTDGVPKLLIGSESMSAPYGGALPALTDQQDEWRAAQEAQFPLVTAASWDIIFDGLNYPDIPSAEGYMPNRTAAWDRGSNFSEQLRNNGSLVLDTEIACYLANLEAIFNNQSAYGCHPYVGVRANTDEVEGWEWPLGDTVTLEINDPVTYPNPDYSVTETVDLASWDPNQTYVYFNLRGVYDIQPGYEVTMTNGETTKTHTVTSLAFTDLDIETDMVTGEASPGSKINVWACSDTSCENRHILADGSGVWTADFGHVGSQGDEQVLFDIALGTWVDSEQIDWDNDRTQYGQRIPNPYIQANPTGHYIQAREWPNGAELTLTIDDPGTPEPVDYTTTAFMQQNPGNPGDPNDILADFAWPESLGLETGFELTVTDGETAKQLTITPLEAVGNPATDEVTGTAEPNSNLQICVNLPRRCITRWVTANGDGDWTVDYSVPGDPPDDADVWDLQPGDNGWAAEFDEDSDRVWYDWNIPNPYIQANPTGHYIQAREWPNGVELTLTIDDPGTPEPVDYTTTAFMQQNPGNLSDPNDILADFTWPESLGLEPGFIITVTDGVTEKILTVTEFQVTLANPTADTVSGTAEIGYNVQVCINIPGRCITRWVTANGDGDWTVDYGVPGVWPDDADTWDLQLGDNGWAAEFDEDSDRVWYDWTVFSSSVGNPYIKASADEDWVHARDWPAGAEITLTVNGETIDTATMVQSPWNPNDLKDTDAFFDLDGVLDIANGDLINITDGTTSRDYTVVVLAQVRWFVGLGMGSNPEQIVAEQEVADNFNIGHSGLELILDVHDSSTAQGELADEIAADNGPDLIGPVGWGGANYFYGEWLDIAGLITSHSFDTDVFNPALVDMYDTEEGQIGLPFAVYPSAIFYLPDLFEAAGLNYPPDEYGESYILDSEPVAWNWDTVAEVGKRLTLDSAGRNATDVDFDADDIVQYGYTWQYENHPNYYGSFWAGGTMFGGGTPGSYTAQVPDAWRAAWEWTYEGIWGEEPWMANGGVESSPEFNGGNPFDSGKIAMTDQPVWYTCCVGDLAEFQFAAMPEYNGEVGGRIDADTFRIWEGTANPDAAFEAMAYLVTDGVQKLIIGSESMSASYVGALPALTDQQDEWRAGREAQFPLVSPASWDIILDGLNYPDVPSAEGYMPNRSDAWNRGNGFLDQLRNNSNFNLGVEILCFQNELIDIFNGRQPRGCPNFTARANSDEVEVHSWPLGDTVTLTIDDPMTELSPDYTATQVVGVASWDPNRTHAAFYLSGVFDIQPGFLVTVSNGTATKSLVVSNLSFTNFDFLNDVVSGIAGPDTQVDVWVCDGFGCHADRHVMTDDEGNWTADFGHPGVGDDEQTLFDIVVGTWIDSRENDEDWDSTLHGENAAIPPACYTLDVTMDPAAGGSVLVEPSTDCVTELHEGGYTEGTEVTLTAGANEHYAFSEWSGDAVGPLNPVPVIMDANKTVTANYTQDEYTLTVNITGNGDVTPSIGAPYHWGDVVDLTPDAHDGWSFSAWSGACIGSSTCSVIMNGNQTVDATFTQNEYELTVNITGNGTVGRSIPEPYHWGDVVDLTPDPDEGWSFSEWTGACIGSGACSVAMDDDKTVGATFTQDEYTLTLNFTGNGGIATSIPAPYHWGDVVDLTPEAIQGWSFSAWSGACTGSGACSVTMDDDKTVGATFTQDEYTLTVNITGNGTVDRSIPEPYYWGDVVDLTSDPDAGWIFSAWSGACTGSGACSVTMNGNQTVGATFTETGPACYALTLSHVGSGSDPVATPGNSTGCPAGEYLADEDISLLASPAGGWIVDSWIGTDNNASTSTGNTVTMPAGIHTVIVNYEAIAAPGAFAKLGPASGIYGSPSGVTLTWEASSGATGYEYCYDTSDNGVCNSTWTDAGTDTSAVISGLSLSSTYYWQVRARNTNPELTYANGGTWWSLRTGLFADVPVAGKEWMRNWIEGFYNAGITTGCGASPRIYCPEREVTRAEMAVFLLRAKHGAGYVPPAATGVFGDVPFAGKEWMQPWIEQFYREGITTGCGAGPIYCPERNVTRAEMAVFVLRAKHGAAYVPPAATGVFLDVPVAGKEWMQPWIEQFYREGITTGCGAGPLYCPERNVTRAEMAVFLGRAYSIPLAP